jgi:hypothetical protein
MSAILMPSATVQTTVGDSRQIPARNHKKPDLGIPQERFLMLSNKDQFNHGPLRLVAG